jgi:predicted metal-dependent hydrolase
MDIRLTQSLDFAAGIKIGIRTSNRAKRVSLISGINGVEAIVPANYSSEELERFVSSKKDWIIKTSRYYSRLKERCGGIEPGTIYFLGSKYRFHIVKDRQQSAVVSDSMKLITFHVLDRRRHKEEIQKWYKDQTGRIIAERLPALAWKLGLKYNRVSIKNQKSRWGSCSKKGNLNFNLLLAAAPPEVIDYVILHELMHLVELDHSPRFWRLVEGADPEYKKHRDWLSSYSPVIKIG